MTIYARPDELVFAENANPGEVVDFPNIPRGWGLAFEQTEGKPPMEWMNAVMKRQDQAIRYLLQRGLPEWSATEDYPAGSRVQRSGTTYQALVGNSDVEPGTSVITWEPWGLSVSDVQELTHGRLLGVQTFTAGGVYTPTLGTKFIIAEAQGGGGAGGGVPATNSTQSSCGGGGAAGAYGKAKITSGFEGAVLTIGSGGAGVVNAAGGNGGATSFGALLSSPGGPGGGLGAPVPASASGASGTSSGNSPNPSGANIDGHAGMSGDNGLVFNAGAWGGAGGNSIMGVGGEPNRTQGQGSSGSGFGSGGAGALNGISSAARAGAAGLAGKIIVWEYA